MNINEIKNGMFELLSDIDSSEDSDEIDFLVDELRKSGDDIVNKLEHAGHVLDTYRASLVKNKERTALLKERERTLKRSIERVNSFVVDSVKECGNLVSTDSYDFKIVKNQPSAIIENEGLIPGEYKKKKETETLDKKAIVNALKNGEFVPGAILKRSERVKF